MSQVPVKWVMPDRMIEQGEYPVEDLKAVGRIPVVPLSALREVVEGLKEQEAVGYTPDAKEAEYRNGYNDAVTDIQRLLASLGER